MIHFIVGRHDESVDVNSTRSLFAALYMSVIGPEVFIVQPGFVQGLVQYMGFAEQTAGDIASAEMWGIALTTVAMTFLSQRLNWRHVFALSLLVMVAGNIASIFATDPLSFGITRFIVGLGAGSVVSLGFAAIGLTRDTDRNFGYLIMWVLVYGAIVLLAMPTAFRLVGMEGMLVFFALFAGGGLACVRWLPRSGEEHVQVEADAVNLPWSQKSLALGAMFAYFLGQGVVWAYLFLVGISGGATEQQVANGLTLSQFAGVAAALCAVAIGGRFGRALPLTVAILLTLLPLVLLLGKAGALVFGVAVCIYNYGWNLTHPYLLASMASFDRTGSVVVYAAACQMLGLANGPWIAARIISEGDYSNTLWLGMALFILSLALILPPVRAQQRLAMPAARDAQPDPRSLNRSSP